MKDAVEIIAEQFRRLPGIGIKSARRLAYFMLERPLISRQVGGLNSSIAF